MQYPIKLKMSDGTEKTFWLSDEKLQFGGTDDGVSDVQINGASIVDGGVANIPFAGQYRLGLVKFTDSSSGIYINYDGYISVASATDAQIIARNNNPRPITIRNMDTAVRTSLTDGKNVFSDTEKAEACETLGAERNEQFELVNSITIAESGVQRLLINTTSDGRTYDFKDVLIRSKLTPSNTGVASIAMFVAKNSVGNSMGTMYLDTWKTSGVQRIQWEYNYGKARCMYVTQSTEGAYNGTQQRTAYRFENFDYSVNPIASIAITSETANVYFAVGSTIEIYARWR